MDGTSNILLIDDHPLYRDALRPVIHQLARRVNIFEASCITDAFRLIDEQPELDLVLLDLILPDGGGLKSLLSVSQLLSNTPIVVISACDNHNLVIQLLNAGARGYIPKSAGSEVIKNALLLVLSGETYIPSVALGSLSGANTLEIDAETVLTQRQDEVLQLLARGYSNKQIARVLNIAETTVRAHVSDILHHLHAHNRTDAVVKAQKLGLLEAVN
ncbi:MAG TPA: response regulator transcription factor [Gammaproteobacteria bacterium]|nr:response regulator transcription factor [Gammaproteobacteria bacterium]